MCSPTTEVIITYIVNLSLRLKIVPNGWKRACLSPLFKDGDDNDPSNYRPIVIIPSTSEILERVVHQQLSAYLEKYKILSKAQFGLRDGHSTTLCILNLLSDIYNKKCLQKEDWS